MIKNPSKICQKWSKIGLRRQMRLGRNINRTKTKNCKKDPPILGSILGSCWGPRRIKNACDFLMFFRKVLWSIFGRSWGHLGPQVERFFEFFLRSTWDLMSKAFRHRFLIDFGSPWNLKNIQKAFVFVGFLKIRKVALDSHLEVDFDAQEASKIDPKRLQNHFKNEEKNPCDLDDDFEPNLSEIGPPRGPSWGAISAIFLSFFACYVGRRFW